MSDIDRIAAAAASRRHGLVTAEELYRRGFSHTVIRRRVASARWTELDVGVYRVAGCPATWESEVLARILAAGPGAVASHRTAGVLWGLEGCRPGAPEITVPRGRRYRRVGVRTHESTDLALIAPVRRNGVPTTPVARTLLDLGAVLPPVGCTWRWTTPGVAGSRIGMPFSPPWLLMPAGGAVASAPCGRSSTSTSERWR